MLVIMPGSMLSTSLIKMSKRKPVYSEIKLKVFV